MKTLYEINSTGERLPIVTAHIERLEKFKTILEKKEIEKTKQFEDYKPSKFVIE